MTRSRSIPGINIQWPWSRLLLSGEKTIETRSYRLPAHYQNAPLALIETPGPLGKKSADITSARIVGLICFSDSFRYSSKSSWTADFVRHRVPANDPTFSFSNGHEKWGWEVVSVAKFDSPISPPTRRGIVFSSKCEIPIELFNNYMPTLHHDVIENSHFY